MVALEALRCFVPRTGEPAIYAKRPPRLADCPDVSVMRRVLECYAARDDAPKSTRLCAFIVTNLENIRVL